MNVFCVFCFCMVSLHAFSQSTDTSTLKKIDRLAYQIQSHLDQIPTDEFWRKRRHKPLDDCFYRKKARKIHTLTDRLEKQAPRVAPDSELGRSLAEITRLGKHPDSLALDLRNHEVALAMQVTHIRSLIPRHLQHPEASAGELLAWIGFFLLLPAIPTGLIWWAIARQAVLPLVLLIFYGVLVGLSAAFLKGFRNAFRR